MTPRLQLISTDFDGTIFAEFEQPPVAPALQERLRQLQQEGAAWVINTGRDLSSLLECLGRAHLKVRPDFLVLVEREIYRHEGHCYVSLSEWNDQCRRDHAELFRRVQPDLPGLVAWVNERFDATVYEDTFSPFCLIASSNADADAIMERLDAYCAGMPELTVVRNDVYARFSHAAYSKGTALAEIGRQLGVPPEHTLAAGDHFNDLPMLSLRYARHLVAPANAIDRVKSTVREQGGFISRLAYGDGVRDGIERALESGS